MMIYAVIDTNVLVSSLLNMQSIPGQVLQSVILGETIPLLSEEIVNEYRDVLAREKFHFPIELVDVVLQRITASGLYISTYVEQYQEVSDPKDRCFYAVTMAGREVFDSMLVTGNSRHFPNKPFVVTPAQFVFFLQSEK